MITFVDLNLNNGSNLAEVTACLDNPACGYHHESKVLFSGWVVPKDLNNNSVRVLIEIKNRDGLRVVETEKIIRPDVFKVLYSDLAVPVELMKVGFSIELEFSCASHVNLIISSGVEDVEWFGFEINPSPAVEFFVRKIEGLEGGALTSAGVEEIINFTKVYPSNWKSLVDKHLRNFVDSVESNSLLISFYESSGGHVQCSDFDLDFSVLRSLSIGDHNYLFCVGGDDFFIIHQHVTYFDGVYFPKKGIYYTFCHDSHVFVSDVIGFIVNSEKAFISNGSKNLSFLVGHSRPYHFLYDGLLALEILSQRFNDIADRHEFYVRKEGAFVDAVKVFNKNNLVKAIDNKSLTELENNGHIFIKLGVLFGGGAENPNLVAAINNIDVRLIEYAEDLNVENEKIRDKLKRNYPIIWLGITGQKRAWVEQVEGCAALINKISRSFPGMAVVFDGWTSSLYPSEVDEIESAKDRSIVESIKTLVPNDINIVDLVGASIDRKIYIASIVDFAVVNYSTGSLNVSRICGRPCITHISNNFIKAYNQHIHRFAYHIPPDKITDEEPESHTIDRTNYHLNWREIYDAIVFFIGDKNQFKGRSLYWATRKTSTHPSLVK